MKKIAVIDDKAEIIEALDELFTNFGYQVHGFKTAEDLLKKVYTTKPDLIICDIMLPGADAFQLFGKLKENDQTSNIPFIILSADANKEQKIKSNNLGISEYITKPYQATDLIQKVKKFIG